MVPPTPRNAKRYQQVIDMCHRMKAEHDAEAVGTNQSWQRGCPISAGYWEWIQEKKGQMKPGELKLHIQVYQQVRLEEQAGNNGMAKQFEDAARSTFDTRRGGTRGPRQDEFERWDAKLQWQSTHPSYVAQASNNVATFFAASYNATMRALERGHDHQRAGAH